HRLDLRAVMGALDDAMSGKAMPQRVRLSLGVAGDISVTRAALGPTRNPLRLRLSKHTANSQDKTLRHKTSPLPFYDRERARLKTLENCDELIFINERGELTEGSYTNIFLSLDGQLYSPPMSSGLLAGVLRAELVARGEVKIKTLYPRDIKRANAVYVGNSVRGLCPAKLKKFDKI
ncbi:MAG: aminotransferase class IV, partial [Robiginitomaculum sp.]